ncbi:DUF4450 domain-containing protein [Pedobacter sp. AW31-3R]|uniref:DUF4450 domain-containing protein n=1 Tax=Pedobacter sp. AW31-3R TaxID=3445781 RepID=UPI003FA119EE
MSYIKFLHLYLLFLFLTVSGFAQELYPPLLSNKNWHGEERQLRYTPVGTSFYLKNGSRRFTRALYGTNTGFRVEAGDLPEFALYMPGMGGNFKLGLISGKVSKWMIAAKEIRAWYDAGSMRYEIRDPLLGKGKIELKVLALGNAEGMIIHATFEGVGKDIQLFWSFGGASGKNFSRNGDMGPDPESVFYLKPENCLNNVFEIKGNQFLLKYGKDKKMQGIFPSADLHLADARVQGSPLLMDKSSGKEYPALCGKVKITNRKDFYFCIQNPDPEAGDKMLEPEKEFLHAEISRKRIADRVRIETPDPFLNTLGGTLSMAADAIWESPSYLHGAIGWRMRLNGWRGPYAADPLGWHDRAAEHFAAYAKSQVQDPAVGPVEADTALNLARSREKMGTAMFSRGYISRDPGGKSIRPHHYDMNLIYMDELLWHFNWSGDLNFVREMWPVIKLHLEWEKRNFDADNNGLYDAYAAIWASDALQYSGGSVTHSSAYNYRANLYAGKIASLLGEDPSAYHNEAEKIVEAMNTQLWMPSKGWYAEYKDALGLSLLHPAAALWTIYQSIDAGVADPFQAWQSLRYVDTALPHIPVRAKGLADQGYYTVSTTNWMPYEWSLNNVVLAESAHTALANWQAGRTEEAFKLWKSELLSSMYLGGSPGNFVQISHYDAVRGEAYRDFADPIGVNARALVEGLFGIVPDALHHSLLLRPGLPSAWDHASLHIPDISFEFKRTGKQDEYVIVPSFSHPMELRMVVKARRNRLQSVTVNGKNVEWRQLESSIGVPQIEISHAVAERYVIRLIWGEEEFGKPVLKRIFPEGADLVADFKNATIGEVFDPQQVCAGLQVSNGHLQAKLVGEVGHRTVFVKLRSGTFSYWYPLCFEILAQGKGKPEQAGVGHPDFSNRLIEPLNLSPYFNDKVTQIFKNRYLSPRPKTTTLQLPVQGIGDWTHPMLSPEINDMGLRKMAGTANQFTLPSGITFNTPADTMLKNIVFTSRWDNYPSAMEIPITGKATHLYLLMAGSTNPMQSRMDNGRIKIFYTDGTADSLLLRNPENWWPIEKDLYEDGFAFHTGAERPLRIHLKTGKVVDAEEGKLWNGKEIEGGAASVIGMAVDPAKTMLKLGFTTLCNDVVMGLMGVTVIREKNDQIKR